MRPFLPIAPLLLALLSGLLYVFSFAPWDYGFLQWIAFVPLFFAVSKLDRTHIRFQKQVFALGLFMAIVICLGGFYWIAFAVEHYGELPRFLSILILIAFCFIGQLQIPIYLLVREKFLSGKQKMQFQHFAFWPIAGGILYVGIESLYPKLFYDTAGNAFYKMLYTRQAAEIGGPFFLTFCSLMVNEFIFSFLFYFRGNRKRSFISLILASLVMTLILSYGMIRVTEVKQKVELAKQGPTLTLSLIQANIGDYLKVASEKGSDSALREVIDRYLDLSKQAVTSAPQTDMIVWPETAYPSLFHKPQSEIDYASEQKIENFIAQNFSNKNFVIGGYDQDLMRLDYNSLFFYRHHDLQVYHKANLLMFGETLPGVELFPSLKSWFPMMGFFGRGPGPQVFEVTNGKNEKFSVAPSICYEALFEFHSLEGVRLGSDFLLNVTNDSWFGEKGEPYLHLALATYRSIETREYLIRSTNTGFSAVVDPTGEIISQTPLFQSAVLTHTIPKKIDIARVPAFVHLVFLRLSQLFALLLLGACLKFRHF